MEMPIQQMYSSLKFEDIYGEEGNYMNLESVIENKIDDIYDLKFLQQVMEGAIEKDNLTWSHVSNLSYFNDPVARAYNIKSIPATFILDETGKIVAKNLRGAALEAKIAEPLN